MRIAFECKDYNKPVSVEKIDAFNSKCSRINDIHKKVFVSVKGYQASAQTAAARFGVKLYKLEEVNKNLISELFEIEQTQLLFGKINLRDYIIRLKNKAVIRRNEYSDRIALNNGNSVEPVLLFIWKRVDEVRRGEMQKQVMSLLRNKIASGTASKEENLNEMGTIKFNENVYYLITEDGDKLYVDSIDLIVDFIFEIHQPQSISNAIYTSFNNHEEESESSIVSFRFDDNQLNFVKRRDEKVKMFHVSDQGTIEKLVTLSTYDPKTDTYQKNDN